jgi:hypothetical protein
MGEPPREGLPSRRDGSPVPPCSAPVTLPVPVPTAVPAPSGAVFAGLGVKGLCASPCAKGVESVFGVPPDLVGGPLTMASPALVHIPLALPSLPEKEMGGGSAPLTPVACFTPSDSELSVEVYDGPAPPPPVFDSASVALPASIMRPHGLSVLSSSFFSLFGILFGFLFAGSLVLGGVLTDGMGRSPSRLRSSALPLTWCSVHEVFSFPFVRLLFLSSGSFYRRWVAFICYFLRAPPPFFSILLSSGFL